MTSSSAFGGPMVGAAHIHRKLWAAHLLDPSIVVYRPNMLSFLFGRPTTELQAVRVMGLVVRIGGTVMVDPTRLRGVSDELIAAGGAMACREFWVDDSTGVVRVLCPSEVMAARAAASGSEQVDMVTEGSLVDFVGRLQCADREGRPSARFVLSSGFDLKHDCMWEILRTLEIVSLYSTRYFAESSGVILAPKGLPPTQSSGALAVGAPSSSAAAIAAAALEASMDELSRRAGWGGVGAHASWRAAEPVVSAQPPRTGAHGVAAGGHLAAKCDPEILMAALQREDSNSNGVALSDLARRLFPGLDPESVVEAAENLMLDGRIYQKDGLLFIM